MTFKEFKQRYLPDFNHPLTDKDIALMENKVVNFIDDRVSGKTTKLCIKALYDSINNSNYTTCISAVTLKSVQNIQRILCDLIFRSDKLHYEMKDYDSINSLFEFENGSSIVIRKGKLIVHVDSRGRNAKQILIDDLEYTDLICEARPEAELIKTISKDDYEVINNG